MPESFESPNLPSSEDLDKVIAEHELQTHASTTPQAATPSVVSPPDVSVTKVNNKEGQCFRCDQTSINFCRHCGQEFCSEHKSKYSTGICMLCIAPDNLGIEFEALVDEEIGADGKTHVHHGRRIKLIGEGWPSSMQMIETMTDEGLEIFIAERQRLLKEAVALSEYHRITLAAAEFKKEYNKRSKIAKLRRRREELLQGSVRLDGKSVQIGSKSRGKTPDEKLAASLGLTMQQFAAFKKLVSK
jgi:hypothetical protein